jgi:hypothetical protein
MNAKTTPNSNNLNYALNQIYDEIKSDTNNYSKVKEVVITYKAALPEDLVGYTEVSLFLKENKIIESHRRHSSGQEKVYGVEDEDEDEIVFIKEAYKLKPKVVIKYLIENSIIPKYTLSLNKKRQLILNNQFILVNLQFNSSNFDFVEYILERSGKIIRKEQLPSPIDHSKKRFHTYLEQIIREPELIKVFFPDVAQDKLMFRNDVKENDLKDGNIKEKNIDIFIKQLNSLS